MEAFWDPGAGVWVAGSTDVPGLATESESIDSLLRKLSELVPELMHLNGKDSELPYSFELITRDPLPLPA